MKMEDDFRDLAPLRPSLDGARWERMVRSVEAAAAPELERRARLAAPTLLDLLSSWTRPAVPAALAVAMAAGALLFGGVDAASEEIPGVSDALGFPDPVAAWVEVDVPPSLEELVLVLEGETR